MTKINTYSSILSEEKEMRGRRSSRRGGWRVAELNYVIRFKPEHLEKVLSGRKNVTVRLGLVRPRFGELLIVCNDLVYGVAEVKRLDFMRLEELTDDIAKREGFKTREDLIRELKRLYPDAENRSIVTVIEFEVKETFSRPRRLLDVIREIRG